MEGIILKATDKNWHGFELFLGAESGNRLRTLGFLEWADSPLEALNANRATASRP